MLRAFFAAAALLRSVTGPGPCDPEIKPLTTRWEHAFALGSGAFFGRGTTPLLSSSLRWMPSYALDPGGDRRVGAVVGLALENPELDPQLGARYSIYHPLVSFAAGYEISPEVVVGLRTGHVRLGAEVDLALIKTLRIGLRPQVDLPDGWPVLELITSYAIAREPRPDSLEVAERPPAVNEDLSRWDNFFVSRVRIHSSALFASPALDTLPEAAKDSVRKEWNRQCRDRERRLGAFLRTGASAPTLDRLLQAMDATVPEFAAAVRAARQDARRDIPAEAPPEAVVEAAIRGLRRALQPEGL
jgi:hypothetical protein